jgi:uncharacterized protein
MTRAFLLAATIMVLALLGGCAGSPTSKFYTLSPSQPPTQVASDRPLSIAVDSISVPDIVDRPQFVLKIDANEVRIDEFARWAEPLKSQIPRVLAADLAQSIPGALVSTYPQRADQAGYRVSVDVQSFESMPGDSVTVAALWSVRSPQKGATVSGRTVVHEPTSGSGYDALVDAHSRALAALSRDIAAAIRSTL